MKRRRFWIWSLLLAFVLFSAILTVGAIGSSGQGSQGGTASTLAGTEIKMVTGKNLPPRRESVQALKELPPAPKSADPFGMELSHKDLSKLDLSQSGQLLSQFANFDSQTVWPSKLPADYQPDTIMNLAKDPGLGLRNLHNQGVTGKGVHVAILDQALLKDHEEYKGRITSYTELGEVAPEPELHGAAVTSILAGKTVGVAPDAQVTYYAVQFVKDWKSGTRTFHYMAAAINKILDDNQQLPADQKIRVISASIGLMQGEDGSDEVMAAYRRAIKEGVLVVTTDMNNRYPYQVIGLGRDPGKDPNKLDSYEPGAFLASQFFGGSPYFTNGAGLVWAPMDSRATAAESGTGDYRFYRNGGLSWSVPWMAGVYALVVQVDPKVTPEEFLKAAHDTGDTITVTKDGKAYKLGPIINPAAVIDHFKK